MIPEDRIGLVLAVIADLDITDLLKGGSCIDKELTADKSTAAPSYWPHEGAKSVIPDSALVHLRDFDWPVTAYPIYRVFDLSECFM